MAELAVSDDQLFAMFRLTKHKEANTTWAEKSLFGKQIMWSGRKVDHLGY